MTSLNTMTKAQRQFMAQRMPRTFRRLKTEAELTRKQHERREQVRAQRLQFRSDRYAGTKALRIDRLTRVQKQRIAFRGSVPVTMYEIIKRQIEREAKISWQEIISDRRSRYVTRPRQVAMYLLSKYSVLSYSEIGRRMRRDHSTVLNARKVVEERPELYANLLEPIEQNLGVR